jgi:hypothetical protein
MPKIKKLPVPPYKQTKLACGPTSLRMVFKYYNKDILLKQIIR